LGSFFTFFEVDESSVLFDAFESIFVLFGAGSSFISFTRFLFEVPFSFNFCVFLPDLALGESA